MSENTLSDHIIAFLCSARSTKAYFDILRERSISRRKKSVVQSTLYRLKKKGLIQRENGGWQITKIGKEYAEQKERYDLIPSPFKRGDSDHQIIIFDVPESMRLERDWLREQLKTFGYRMVQRSVWIGPGPMPSEFKKKVIDLDIKVCIKTYKLA